MRTTYLLFLLLITAFASRPVKGQSAGQPLDWLNVYDNGSGFSAVMGVTTDGAGNTYLTGFFNGSIDFDPGAGTSSASSNGVQNDIFIQKLDVNGNHQWVVTLGGTEDDRGIDIDVDPGGNVYVTGYYRGTVDFDPSGSIANETSAGEKDVFVANFNTSGVFQWAYSGGGSAEDIPAAIEVDASGNSFTVGSTSGGSFNPGSSLVIGEGGGTDAFYLKINNTGSYQWAYAFGSTGDESANDIAIFDNSIFYIAGAFEGEVDFDVSILSSKNRTSNGGKDAFVLRLSTTTGGYGDAANFGGPSDDIATGLDLNTDQVYVTGSFGGTVDFYPGGLGTENRTTIGASDDFYLLTLDTGLDYLWVETIGVYTAGVFSVIGGSAKVAADGDLVHFAGTFEPFANSITQIYNSSGTLLYTAGLERNQIVNRIHSQNNKLHVGGFKFGTVQFDPCDENASHSSSNIAANSKAYAVSYDIEESADIPTFTASDPTINEGESVELSFTGDLNSASQWQWYEGTCMVGTPAGTGTSITVSPTTTTNYYVRGEGYDCIVTGCAMITVTVIPDLSDENDITDFTFPGIVGPAVIDPINHTVIATATATASNRPGPIVTVSDNANGGFLSNPATFQNGVPVDYYVRSESDVLQVWQITINWQGLSGSYGVGPTGTFPTLTDAMSQIVLVGLGTDVILEVEDGYDETETVFLTNQDPSHNLMIRPASGASNINLHQDPSYGAIFRFSELDASNITIDGADPGSGNKVMTLNLQGQNEKGIYFTTRVNDLTFRNLSISIEEGIGVYSTSGTTPLTDITIANCDFIAENTSTTQEIRGIWLQRTNLTNVKVLGNRFYHANGAPDPARYNAIIASDQLAEVTNNAIAIRGDITLGISNATDVLHNTIHIYGSGSETGSNHWAIGNATNIKNNSIDISRTSGAGTSKHGIAANVSVDDSGNNIYILDDGTSNIEYTNNFTDQATLSTFVPTTTYVDPIFTDVNNADLSLTGASLQEPDLRATTLAEVTTDITGAARSSTSTSRGAFESPNNVASITAFTFPDQLGDAIIDVEQFSVTAAMDPEAGDLSNVSPSIVTFPGSVINPGSGVPQDFTSPVLYNVTAEAGNMQQWTVTVSKTNFAPTDISLNNSSIDENNALGSIIGVLSSTDINPMDVHIYAMVSGMGDDDNDSFVIDGNELKANAVFDFETKNTFNIRVQTDDQSGGQFQKELVITIGDIADETAPSVLSLEPSNSATDISVDANLIITFDEPVFYENDAHLFELRRTSDNSLVEDFVLGNAIITGSGTAQITIDPEFDLQEATSYYVLIGTQVFIDGSDNSYAGISTPAIWDFTTTKQDQTITFDGIFSKTFGDAPFTLIASASSGLDVVFTVVSGPISLNGNEVSITGAGEAVIAANQSGDASFNPAPEVQQSIDIEKADQTIAFDALADKTFDDAPFNLTATASSGLDVSFTVVSGPVSLDGNEVTITGVGTAVIATNQAGDANFNSAPEVQQGFDIEQADQSIIFDAILDKFFDEAPFNLTATASSGLDVVYSVVSGPVSLNGNEVTITGVGTAVIAANQTGNASYNAASETQQSFEIQKADQTITFDAIANKTLGDAPFTLSATASSGLDVEFSVVSGPISLSGDEVTITGAGTAIIATNQPGNANYNAAAEAQQSFDIAKADQAITFDAIADKTLGDAPFNLTATASSGLDVAFSVVSGPVSLSGNQVTITGTGTAVIAANQSGDASFNPAPEVQQSFDVGKADQSINFAPIADKTFGDAPFNLTATASSGLDVAFSVVSGPVSLSGNQVTITGAGTAVIAANQSGDASFNSAPEVQQSFDIGKADQSITFDAITDKTFGDVPLNLTATASSGLDVAFSVVSGPVSISGNEVTITGAGTAVIAANQSGDASFNPAPEVQQSFDIGKADQTITISPIADKLTTDAPFTVVASTTSSLMLTYDVDGPATINASTITLDGNAGNVTVTVSQTGSTNYNPATESISFNVTDPVKTDQTISFDAIADKTFGDAPFNLTATASSGLDVEFSVVSGPVTLNGNEVTITGAGTAVIAANQPGDASFNPAPELQRSFEIAKADQTISLQDITDQQIQNSPVQVVASTTSGLPLDYVVTGPATLAGTTLSLDDVGMVTVTVSQGGNQNYNPAQAQQTSFLVTDPDRTDQTITFPQITTKTFGQANFSLGATATSNLAVQYTVVSGPISISGSTVIINGAGVATVAANQSGDAGFNPAPEVRRTFTINKASQSISFSDIEDKTFGDDDFTVNVSSSSGLPVSLSVLDGPASVSGNTVTLTGAGTVIISATQSGNINFNDAPSINKLFEVAKASQSITIEPIDDKITGDGPFQVMASSDSGLPLDYQVTGPASINATTLTLTGVPGEVTVTATQQGNDDYNAASASTSFSVIQGKLPQVISFAQIPDQTYGGQLMLQATADSGLPVDFELLSNNLDLQGNTIRFTGTGTASIRAFQSGDDRFLEAELVHTFTISPAPLTLRAQDQTRSYGSVNPELSFTAEGLVYNESLDDIFSMQPTVMASAEELDEPGTYSIRVTGGMAANYLITREDGMLTVTKVTLEVTADDQNRKVGEAAPDYTLSYTGFVNGQDESILGTPPTAMSTATAASAIGSYPIIPQGGSSSLYDFDYVDGTLTISGGTVSGVAQGSNSPLASGTAKLWKQETNASFTMISQVNLNADGSFAIDGVDVGAHTLSITPSAADQASYFTSYYGNTNSLNEAAVFDLAQGNPQISLTMVEKSVQQGNGGEGEINGTLVFDPEANGGRILQGASLEDAEPVPNTEIWILDAEGQIVGHDVTDESGAYSFVGLSPGTYGLRLNYNGLLLDFSGATVDLAAGDDQLDITTAINTEGQVIAVPTTITSLEVPTIEWKAFPNPATHLLNITLEEPGNWNLQMINLNGQQVLHQEMYGSSSTVNVQLLPKGIYILILNNNERQLSLQQRIMLK